MVLPSPAQKSPRFVHVVNPYLCPHGSEGDRVQRFTFETMRKAKLAYEALYAQPSGEEMVAQVAAAYEEDQSYARDFFSHIESIHRSALDVGKFQVPRKLPLLFDVLAAGRLHAGPLDYMILTNTDICLLMGFYDAMATLIGLGYDSIVVNRRTVEPFPPDPRLAPIISASMGACHPGFDCFVFRAGLFDDFIRGTSVIGRGWVMRPLLYNLVAKAGRMIMLKDVHLTYHLGDDNAWSGKENSDYDTHNLLEAYKLIASSGPKERERLKDFCRTHPEFFGHEVEFPPPIQ